MPKLVDTERHVYYAPIETWLVEPKSSSAADITAELDKIPSTAPAGSIAEILTSNGLTVKMKNSDSQWIDI